jgi:hypothetical protein
MPRKPRLVGPEAIEIAEMIDRVIAARLEPNSTFAERQAAAVAIGGRESTAMAAVTGS